MKNKIKIGFYCSSISWGGLELNLFRHAKWMNERGWEVTLFCVEGTPLHAHAKDENIEIKLVDRNKKYFDFKNARKLGRLISELKIDLVWIRDTRDMSVTGLAKIFSNKPFKILYQQAMQIGVNKRDWLHTKRFSRIDLWISPLKYLADQVREKTKFPADRIRVIPLGIEVEKYLNEEMTKSKAREQLDLNQDGFIFGILGRIDPKKGQLFIVKCLSKLRKEGVEAELLMVGDKTIGEGDGYFEEIMSMIESEELNAVVHIRPFMEDVTSFYRAIDCFVMASEGETFGMVTVEAMLFGVPVIGTNTSGTPELLDNGKMGYLFTPGDQNEFNTQGMKLIEDIPSGLEKADLAKKKVLNSMSHRFVCEKIEYEIKSLFKE